LIAYYWDIERFKDVDSFIGYMVMGANSEVSGTSLNRMKTDKARAEVKGKFFMLFLQSHKDNSPYKPLIDLLRSRLGGGNNQKKRYIKFLTDLLELVYYALKYRLSFSQAVAWKVKELEREKARLRSQLERAREQGNQEKASLLGWEYENITLNKQAWELVLRLRTKPKLGAKPKAKPKQRTKPKQGTKPNIKPRTKPRDRSRLGVCFSWWWR
jgi:ssDNA-binding Zn-finger/Zn-ribbon topoisomerase 1